tara:strand:+ start:5943 stop:6176 length:234 start_codon:yes stop_codon:yes gene_type:complete
MYKNPAYKNVNSSSSKKKVVSKPLYKPRKDLSKLQKDLMKTHKEQHTKEHMKMMKNLMLKGYCFQQAHGITIKKIGK